jgi:putative ABC transport system ATP-binding protein
MRGEIIMIVIKTENLSKVYGKKDNKVVALDNVNIEIEKGEFVAIIGASGSGKSTLLHQIGGVDGPTSGKVIIDGKDIYSLNEGNLAVFRRRKIGFVFQSFNLIPVLSVDENIRMPALLDHQKVDEIYYKDLIKTLGLEDRLNHLPSELSGGQQQRVAMARALINKPAIILADEPTGNLDSENSKEIMEMLKVSIRKYNQTAIVITHDLTVAENTDRIIKIKDGKVVK